VSTVWQSEAPARATGFRHEALLYAGPDQFRDAAASFIHEGLASDERVLVMVPETKIDLVRSAVGRHDPRVSYADMTKVGRNPARIIPAWREFVGSGADGRRMRGIGEPIWAGRSSAELAECQGHESLLNLAFGDHEPITLMCPYDLETLDGSVIASAYASHPRVVSSDRRTAKSRSYIGSEGWRAINERPLPEPPVPPAELDFDLDRIRELRVFAARLAADFGLPDGRASEFVLAVDELATNSVRHGGGGGTMRIWPDGDDLVGEIHDAGRIDQPLAGRIHPVLDDENGRGLWLVNQICDLVETRSGPTGTVIRLRVSRPELRVGYPLAPRRRRTPGTVDAG
jgi:anti-sigma regulatory factor (Ser/Thr protein kinase)